MKINWNYVCLVLFIGVLLEGFIIYKLTHETTTVQQATELDKAIKKDFAVDTIIRYRDAAGKQHAQTTGNQNTFDQNTIDNNDTPLGGPDTTAKILKIQANQITYWQQIAAVNEARALKAEQQRDAKGNLLSAYEYHDPHKDIVFHTDNATFDFTGRDTITHTDYWKRKWFLGARHYYTDIFSADTATRITGFKTLSINTDHNKGWNLKGQLRGTHSFIDGNSAGSAGIDIIYNNWEIAAGYGYMPSLRKWGPLGTVTYNVFSLK